MAAISVSGVPQSPNPLLRTVEPDLISFTASSALSHTFETLSRGAVLLISRKVAGGGRKALGRDVEAQERLLAFQDKVERKRRATEMMR